MVEEVEIQIPHTHLELADLWARMIAPLNHDGLATFKAYGLDLLADHRDDFPPEYLPGWMPAPG